MTVSDIRRFPDLEALTVAAGGAFVDVIARIQREEGREAHVALTGGTAGIALLERLARFDAAASAQAETFPALRIDWSGVHVYFGDERDVSVEHSDSNEGQARRALLDAVNIGEDHIHGWGLTRDSLDERVDAYETFLATAPAFDIHLLGVGPEGHINSLFPHTPALAESRRAAVAVHDSPKPPSRRGTLTLPEVNRSARVWFLVSGSNKAEAALRVARGPRTAEWPATGASGRLETVLWITESAAALL